MTGGSYRDLAAREAQMLERLAEHSPGEQDATQTLPETTIPPDAAREAQPPLWRWDGALYVAFSVVLFVIIARKAKKTGFKSRIGRM